MRTGKLNAINRAQAVIEFDLEGDVLAANANFLGLFGYPDRRDQGPAPPLLRRPAGRLERRVPGLLGAARTRRVRVGRVQARGQGRARDLDPGDLQPDLRSARQAGEGGEVCERCDRRQAALGRVRGQGGRDRPRPGDHRVRPRRQDPDRQPQLPGGNGLHAARDPGPAPQHLLHRRIHPGRGVPRFLAEAQRGAVRERPFSPGSASTTATSGSRRPTTRSSTSTGGSRRSSSTPTT